MRCFNIFSALLILAGLNVVQAAWVLSAKGASCDASCTGGETCDAERMQLITSEEAMALAVTSGGVRACAVYVGDDDSLDIAQPYQLDDYITGLTDLPVLCFVNGVNSTCAASGAQLRRLCCCSSGSGNVADQCPTPTTTSSTATVTTLTSTIVTTTSSTATTQSTITATETTSRTTFTTSVTTTTLTTTTVTVTTVTTVTVTTVTVTATSTTSSISKTLTESTTVTTKTATSTSQTTATSTTSGTSSVTTSSTTATVTTSTSSSVTTSSTTATVTTSTSSSVTTSSTTVTVTTSTSSSVTVTTSTSSSVTVTTSTSSSVTVTTSTSSSVTATTSTSSSATSTLTTSSSSTSSATTTSSSTTKSSTTSTTLLQRMVVPSNADPDQAEGAVVLATLEGALAATNADQDAIVLSTDAGNVSVVKLSSASADPSSSLVFQVDLNGQHTSNGTIAVSVPVSLILQLEESANVMLVVTQLTEDITESLSNSDAGTVILSGPMLEISLVEERSGEVSVSNVSNLTDPVVFRLGDATPYDGDVCVFFDVDTNSWSSEGMSVASSSQIADVGALTSGTWCVATHLSLFSIAHTVPFNDILEPKDSLVSGEDYMIAVGLMLALCIPICTMACIWFCFRFCRAANSGKTHIKDSRGRSIEVKFTRSEVQGVKGEAEKKRWMSKSRSNMSGNSQSKVLVTWEVEPAEMLASLDHMQGHGWVAMDVAVGPRMTEKKSTKSLKDIQSPREPVSKELRKASQQDDQMEEMREELARLEEEEEIVEVSLDAFQVCELYKDREAVNYWSATHQTWMQAFVAGRATWDENNQPYYNVLVGPRKQRREQVSCSMLCPAFKDGETIFYDEGDGTERSWRKGVVAQVLHAKAMVQVLEGSGKKPKDVPFSRVCRRYENDTTIRVYRGRDAGWQTALVEKVQDFDGSFSPFEVTAIQVLFASGTDPVTVQTCFVQNSKENESSGTEHFSRETREFSV